MYDTIDNLWSVLYTTWYLTHRESGEGYSDILIEPAVRALFTVCETEGLPAPAFSSQHGEFKVVFRNSIYESGATSERSTRPEDVLAFLQRADGMKMIHDRGIIAQLLKEYGLPEAFDCEKLSFHVRTYEKGEQISSPGTAHHAFLFLREEDVRLGTYFESGSYVTVDMPGLPLLVLGDFEFAMGGTSMFWAEARADIQALCLPFEENGQQLRGDPDFLFFLLKHVTAKALLGRTPHVLQSFPLRDRILSVMRSAPDGTLRGINETAARLDCSSRQLLRVLNDLIQDGLAQKAGRGCYRLTDGDSPGGFKQ